MADDASHLFDLSDTQFLAHISFTYPQLYILWQICPLPLQRISCVISTLHRKPCEKELHMMRANRDCIGIGPASDPPCQSTLLSNIHPSIKLKSYRYMDTGSDMPTTQSNAWKDLGNSRFLRYGGRLQRPTYWLAYLTQESLLKPRPAPDWTYILPGSLKPTALRTLQSNEKRPSRLVSSTPFLPQQSYHTTPKPVRLPTW